MALFLIRVPCAWDWLQFDTEASGDSLAVMASCQPAAVPKRPEWGWLKHQVDDVNFSEFISVFALWCTLPEARTVYQLRLLSAYRVNDVANYYCQLYCQQSCRLAGHACCWLSVISSSIMYHFVVVELTNMLLGRSLLWSVASQNNASVNTELGLHSVACHAWRMSKLVSSTNYLGIWLQLVTCQTIDTFYVFLLFLSHFYVFNVVFFRAGHIFITLNLCILRIVLLTCSINIIQLC